MKRAVELLCIAFALYCAAEGVEASSASAQMGVEDPQPQSLDRAERQGVGVRIGGGYRHRLVPETYTVRRGDTLWDVTGRYYGNPWEWPRVWSYNPEITNPHWIYPLDTLRLLAPGGAIEDGGEPRTIRPSRGTRSGTVFLRQEGYLDEEALGQAGVIVGSPEDHMLLAPYDHVYVEFEEGVQGQPRGEYTVFREMEGSERQEGEEGRLVRIFGTVRIETYDPERRTARAQIIEALDPIERGFQVAPIPRQFDMVPPQPAERDLVTEIAATLRPRELLGEQQIVFLPVGREEGVRMGNRFFIVRAGDNWRASLPANPENAGSAIHPPDEPEEMPAEILAEGRVVHVRPHSATLMITRSVSEVRIGDRAEMRRGY
jgi:hypothetical protein